MAFRPIERGLVSDVERVLCRIDSELAQDALRDCGREIDGVAVWNRHACGTARNGAFEAPHGIRFVVRAALDD